MRNDPSTAAALDENPFASLEHETTRTFQVSDELLEMARENAASNGATRAYEVPAELLEMARRKKMARAAASQAPEAVAADETDAPHLHQGKEVTHSGPRLIFSDLSAEDRAWVESALVKTPPKTPTVPRPPAVTAPPQRKKAAAKKRSPHWPLIMLGLVALSAVAAQYAWLIGQRQMSTATDSESGTAFGTFVAASQEQIESVKRYLK